MHTSSMRYSYFNKVVLIVSKQIGYFLVVAERLDDEIKSKVKNC